MAWWWYEWRAGRHELRSATAGRKANRSPDPRHHLRRPNHRIPRLAPERRRELGHVRQRPVHTPLLRRVRIHRHPRAQRRRTVMLAEALRVCDEVPLFRRVALDLPWPAVALERALERVVAREHAAVVGDVLA